MPTLTKITEDLTSILNQQIKAVKLLKSSIRHNAAIAGTRKITIRVYSEDTEYLQKHNIQYNAVMREALHLLVEKMKEEEEND